MRCSSCTLLPFAVRRGHIRHLLPRAILPCAHPCCYLPSRHPSAANCRPHAMTIIADTTALCLAPAMPCGLPRPYLEYHIDKMRRMNNAMHDMRAPLRRQRGRSRSPPRVDPVRRQRRSRSPQGYGPPPDRQEKGAHDNSRRVKTEVFQSGAGPCGGVCTVCLGRHDHTFTKCDNSKLWDGAPSAARKNEQGCLVTANGLALCFDWQVPKGCRSTSHLDWHICSGCGGDDHGAQTCPRAERA